ncbi:hypothetical protein F5Y00DRAFT_258401 [Daldinia vernicosa]|uniref:uncharacterized protein n=1 Tax=Daldinia vernicosa TaxID=114800 RepID=UPI0020072126|nr:uncharacterized protein F5Y00DRAFT_258401 [Daldinia vernicosa]KAI0852555.1 hypothetical protein F5Y00DRAFT_258401 [Daldinia vernicosa]
MAPLLPGVAAHARSLLSAARSTANDLAARSTTNVPSSPADALQQLGPLAARSILLARDDDNSEQKVDPHKGAVRPQDINNTAVFVLFGLIGAALVCTGIWFFFWAKNGGFYFKENDWEDYKSTVLRRKGPNGTILSNATPTTQLGGGSVYKDVDDGRTEYTGGLTQMTGDTGSTLTGITAGASDLSARERRRQKRERKDREREKKKDRRNREKSGRRVGEDGVLVDEQAEVEAKEQLRAYRNEKAARVGGINKESEGSTWDGSTNPESSTAGSDLHSNRHSKHSGASETTADGGRHKSGGGIRKVYSTADRNADREKRAEARRLREESRASGRGSSSGVKRDYSFQRARAGPQSAVSSGVRASTIEEEPREMAESSVGGRFLPPPSGWVPSEVSAESADTGTKSYHHVIPGLSPSTVSGTDVRDYAEDRGRDRDKDKDRKKRRESRGKGKQRE